MERKVNTKFYVFRQNNSGGYFIKNDDVSIRVIIEAVNDGDAKVKAERIFEPYSEYCACCEERWSTDMGFIHSYDECPKFAPDEYIKDISEGNESAIIYYIDGSKARYDLVTQEIVKIDGSKL